MELWQDTQLFFNKMIFHFDVEEDLPALLAFITSFLVSILTLYGITKALGLCLFEYSSSLKGHFSKTNLLFPQTQMHKHTQDLVFFPLVPTN